MKLSTAISGVLPLVLSPLVAGCAPGGVDIVTKRVDTGNATMWFAPDCSPIPGFEGYGTNHFSIITKDLDKTVDFYTKAFGFRLVFIFSPIPEFKTAYLGHNRGNFPSCQAWAGKAVGQTGQIELLWLKDPTSELAPTTQKAGTFSHIGIFTPDVAGACNRVASLGGKILKPAGEYIKDLDNPIGIAYGLDPSRIKHWGADKKAALVEGFKSPAAGIQHFCFATDLDGNLLEIQPTAA